jgi:hypothetical protein
MYSVINQCYRTSRSASFHSGDPDMVVPFVLYTVPLYTQLTCRLLPAQVTLSFAFISDFFQFILQCTLHWLQLRKCFSLRFCLEIYNFSFFCWKLAVATTALNFEHIRFLVAPFFVCVLFSRSCTVPAAAPVFRPWADPDSALIFVSGFYF